MSHAKVKYAIIHITMARVRLLVLVSTIIIVGIVGTIAILYARGYRLQNNVEGEDLILGPTGLLVANSEPKAAQVFVNGKIKTATDNAISLPPNTYDISIKKEGYQGWEKKVTIEKETVTQVDAFLISQAPSLTALTFSGAVNPIFSEDFSKIVYAVPQSEDNIERAGLWIMETVNLPLGFNRDPRRITDGDLTNATYELSPDAREVLLTTSNGIFLLDISKFTPQTARTNIALQVEAIRKDWIEIREKRQKAKIAPLPDKIEEIFTSSVTNIYFSPDENRILYTALKEASLPEGVVKQLPGSSTQEQARKIVPENTYVYDIREDRNFKVAEPSEMAYWLSNSLNLVIPSAGRITILDYDGTNRKTVFSGNYIYPNAYPSTNANRLLILTNFGASEAVPNLYWLSLQ